MKSRTFRITVEVTFDATHGDLDKMESELAKNLDYCVDRGYLFDSMQEVEIEQWIGDVEEVTEEHGSDES